MPIESTCWSVDASLNLDGTLNCSTKKACTTRCGGSRLASARRSRRRSNYGATPLHSRDHGNVTNSLGAEDAAVAFDFGRRAERPGVLCGELHRGPAFCCRYLADQADRVKDATAAAVPPAENAGPKDSRTLAQT